MKENCKLKKTRKGLSKSTIWTLRITLITFVLAVFVSFITELASTKSNIVICFLILFFLIVIAILFDAIGVAATSCDVAPLLSMASKKIKGAKTAVKLINNAEKVSNICNDVIGDMAGIISGTCSAAIIFKMMAIDKVVNEYSAVFSILLSSVVSAITVGGKAFFKSVAINNAKEMMLFAGKILSVFPEKNKTGKKRKQK